MRIISFINNKHISYCTYEEVIDELANILLQWSFDDSMNRNNTIMRSILGALDDYYYYHRLDKHYKNIFHDASLSGHLINEIKKECGNAVLDKEPKEYLKKHLNIIYREITKLYDIGKL